MFDTWTVGDGGRAGCSRPARWPRMELILCNQSDGAQNQRDGMQVDQKGLHHLFACAGGAGALHGEAAPDRTDKRSCGPAGGEQPKVRACRRGLRETPPRPAIPIPLTLPAQPCCPELAGGRKGGRKGGREEGTLTLPANSLLSRRPRRGTQNRGGHSAGGNSSWCPKLERWTTHRGACAHARCHGLLLQHAAPHNRLFKKKLM